MIDRETGIVWTHLDGIANRGPLQGERLAMLPLIHMTWEQWRRGHPDTLVLSPDTPFQSRYRSISIGMFNPREATFGDDRLAGNALVVGVEVKGEFRGYPTEELEKVGGVVNDTLAGQPIVVIYDAEARTGIAYLRTVNDQTLEFHNPSYPEFELWNQETGSTWDRQGRAVSGALTGASLEFVPSFISEWYGWSGYHPETTLFQADQ